MMKYIKRVGIVLCMLILMSGITASAEDAVKLMEIQTLDQKPLLFVKGIETDIDSADVLVGNDDKSTAEYERLIDAGIPIETMILIDNSLSIKESSRDTVKNLLLELIASRSANEKFSIATFGEEMEVIADMTSDYAQLKEAVESIEYVDRDTYLTDVLYELIKKDDFDQSEDGAYRRIMVLSDGVDNNTLGYTTSELEDLLQERKIPVYTVGLYNKSGNNTEELRKMFAFARITDADWVVLDDLEDPLEFIPTMQKDGNIVRFDITLNDSVKDGSEKTITLDIQTGGASVRVSADSVRMPQEAVEEIVPEEEPKEEIVEKEDEETEEKEDPQEESSLNNRILLVIIGAAVLVIAVITIVVISIIYMVKKNRMNEIVEVEDPFGELEPEENNTVMLSSDYSREPSGNTVYIFDQPRQYVVRLTDINVPSRSFQKPIQHQLVIGRSPTKTDICIDYDPSISGRHCMIELSGNKFYLVDLQASNGTYLNGNRVLSKVELVSGGIIKMGRVQMRVEI